MILNNLIRGYFKNYFLVVFCLFFSLGSFSSFGQEVAVLKYEGGGDWYANPTAVPNLIKFSNENNKTSLAQKPKTVETDSEEIIFYPILFMTGHGNVVFNEKAVQNLRAYLVSGGFLHISDNYGLDASVRREMKKVFPELEFQEIPLAHPIYHQNYSFSQLPKIHEHDGKRAQGFGLFYNERLVCFYDYESDLSDGWEDQSIHNDPNELRLKALQMGANIISYAFLN